MRRKEVLAEGCHYHIFNKSIAGYEIFKLSSEYVRMLNLVCYYQSSKVKTSFSQFVRLLEIEDAVGEDVLFSSFDRTENLVEVVAYCIMPTHFHFILTQLKPEGISIFTGNIQNSYSRYFNLKHKRKGPLWEGRFKSILIESDEQLIHLTRYIHLNPVTAGLIDKPENWLGSSYKEYLSKSKESICRYENILEIEPPTYEKFVEDKINYQEDLVKIKHLIFE